MIRRELKYAERKGKEQQKTDQRKKASEKLWKSHHHEILFWFDQRCTIHWWSAELFQVGGEAFKIWFHEVDLWKQVCNRGQQPFPRNGPKLNSARSQLANKILS